MAQATKLVLLTGATGYVGGRLLPLLEGRGLAVRCLTRRPEALQGRVATTTEVVRGDVLDAASLPEALKDVDTAYFLVHCMGSSQEFERFERQAAENFARAVRNTALQRIVYLGGLGDESEELSPHLRSRHEVGRILRTSGAETIEFRAGIIIGSGSLSFELIRSLVERLPVMVCPRWVSTPTQPIAIEDVLAYLLAAIDLPRGEDRTFEIGGSDQASYGDIMLEYARQRGLRRRMIAVPVLTPHLSSLWLGLVTPVYARVGRKLIEGVRNPTVVRNAAALEAFPIRPRGLRDALARAIENEDRDLAETRWSDALSSSGSPRSYGGVRFGTRLVDSRAIHVATPPEQAFAPIRRIGGKTGWYFGTTLWQLRGMLDLLVGGVGLRRGRKHPDKLYVGDTVDFWRVEAFEPNRMLRLVAEMRLPGRAWLQFEVEPEGDGSLIRQTAIFDPVGLPGLAYWYSVYPLHELVFAGMLKNLADAAVKQ